METDLGNTDPRRRVQRLQVIHSQQGGGHAAERESDQYGPRTQAARGAQHQHGEYDQRHRGHARPGKRRRAIRHFPELIQADGQHHHGYQHEHRARHGRRYHAPQLRKPCGYREEKERGRNHQAGQHHRPSLIQGEHRQRDVVGRHSHDDHVPSAQPTYPGGLQSGDYRDNYQGRGDGPGQVRFVLASRQDIDDHYRNRKRQHEHDSLYADGEGLKRRTLLVRLVADAVVYRG